MPHLNSRGDVAHGVGGGYASLNNVRFSHGGAFGWIDDDTILFANGDDNYIVSTYHVPTKTIARLGTTAGNWGFAGGGQGAWWFGDKSGDRGLWSTIGFRAVDAGLLGMGPDGAICYKPSYQSEGPTWVRETDGRTWTLTAGSPEWVSLQGQGRVLWTEHTAAYVRNLPTPLIAAGRLWRAEAVYVANTWWICYYSEKRGIVLHPFDSLTGFSILPTGNGWHTAHTLSDGVVRIATATGQGEQAGEIWVRDYDVVLNLVRDPWGTNVWSPAERIAIESTNTSASRPVTSLPKFADPKWLGYFKVMGRYGDRTISALAEGANITLGSLGECDNALSNAEKVAQVQAWIAESRQVGAAIVPLGCSREDIQLLIPYWAHVNSVYVTAEGSGIDPYDTANIEQQVAAYEAILKEFKLPRRPVMLYIDAPLDPAKYRAPKGVDWQAIRLYLGPASPATSAEAIDELRQSYATQVACVPSTIKIVVIAQSYDRNGAWSDISILKDMQPVYAEFIQPSRTVGGYFFSYLRPGGALSHPELLEWHREIFAANPGTPAIVTIPWPAPAPVPPTPEPPAPKPTPTPAPTPELPAPSATLTVVPETIEYGQTAVLSWSSQYATSAISSWNDTPGLSGQLVVGGNPGVTDFIYTATGPGGTAIAHALFTINPEPPANPGPPGPPTPPVPPPPVSGNPRNSVLQKILYWLGLWR